MANIGETLTLQGGIKTGVAPGQEQYSVGKGAQVKILNTRTVNGQLYYDIQHIGGGTGWTSASGLDSALQAPAPAQISSTTQANKITSPVNPATVGNQEANVLASMGNQVNKATQSLTNAISDQQKQNEKDLAAEKKKEDAAMSEIKTLTTPFREQTETAGRAKYGTDEVLADQKALLGELDQLLTEGNDLIRQQKEVTGLAAIRNPRIQKTMDDVLARAGVIEAVVNLQNTYLANAYNAIDRTIAAITGDRQDRINYYTSVLALADRNIVELTSEKRALADKQIGILQYNLEQGVTTANYIKELMINPSTALAMAKSGVTLNDSVEQINAKMANYQKDQEIRDLTNQFTSAGAQPVFDPAGVPAHQLLSFTDSSGKVHYFKMPEKPKTTDGSIGADDFLNSFSLEKWLNSSIEPETPTTGGSSSGGNPPNYTPSSIGSSYIDPSTGDIWQFTGKGGTNGWVRI